MIPKKIYRSFLKHSTIYLLLVGFISVQLHPLTHVFDAEKGFASSQVEHNNDHSTGTDVDLEHSDNSLDCQNCVLTKTINADSGQSVSAAISLFSQSLTSYLSFPLSDYNQQFKQLRAPPVS